jgi:hypothetical protein
MGKYYLFLSISVQFIGVKSQSGVNIRPADIV